MHFLLIDFENIQRLDMGTLQPGACQILVFLGASQSKLPLESIRALQPYGSDVEYIKMAGSGNNALDFHIAFYVGQRSAQHPSAQFTILSADTGFDPLIRHLVEKNIRCIRTALVPGAALQVTKEMSSAIASSAKAKQPVDGAPASGSPVVTAKPAKKVAAPSKDQTRSRADEALARLKGLKKARPVRVATPTSSVSSWFKPKLKAKESEAVIQCLAGAGKIKIEGTKVTYTLN